VVNLVGVGRKENDLSKVIEFILNFTTTIGLRYYKVELERKVEEVETKFGKFRVKVLTLCDGSIKIKLEADDVLKYSIEKM